MRLVWSSVRAAVNIWYGGYLCLFYRKHHYWIHLSRHVQLFAFPQIEEAESEGKLQLCTKKTGHHNISFTLKSGSEELDQMSLPPACPDLT